MDFMGAVPQKGNSNMESFQFHNQESDYGGMCVHPMTAKAMITPKHPLEARLKNAALNEEAQNRAALVFAQGPAGPMIRAMELRAANSVGRLPFLQGSHFQRDVLTGKDEEIDFDDVFALTPRASETAVHPHTVMDSINTKMSF